MEKKPTWWQRRKIEFGLGVRPAKWTDLGQPDASTVIRFKDYFVNVMEKDGEIINLGWSKDPHMFPDCNINDFWTAKPAPRGNKEER